MNTFFEFQKPVQGYTKGQQHWMESYGFGAYTTMGVIDGFASKGIEGEEDIAKGKSLLRVIGYKQDIQIN